MLAVPACLHQVIVEGKSKLGAVHTVPLDDLIDDLSVGVRGIWHAANGEYLPQQDAVRPVGTQNVNRQRDVGVVGATASGQMQVDQAMELKSDHPASSPNVGLSREACIRDNLGGSPLDRKLGALRSGILIVHDKSGKPEIGDFDGAVLANEAVSSRLHAYGYCWCMKRGGGKICRLQGSDPQPT